MNARDNACALCGATAPAGSQLCRRCMLRACEAQERAEAFDQGFGPRCGHSACRQNWIEWGDARCVWCETCQQPISDEQPTIEVDGVRFHRDSSDCEAQP